MTKANVHNGLEPSGDILGHSNTESAVKTKAAILNLLNKMGWSQADAAEIIFSFQHQHCDCNEHCDEKSRKFHEAFKKQLSRGTIAHQRLQSYLEILANDERVIAANLVLPTNMAEYSSLPAELTEELTKISASIYELIEPDK